MTTNSVQLPIPGNFNRGEISSVTDSTSKEIKINKRQYKPKNT